MNHICKLTTCKSITYLAKSIAAVFICACLLLPSGNAKADHDLAREPLPKNWKEDAELTDVFFLNAQLGWAVGAQGVILRTKDGGNHWTEISNVTGTTNTELSLDQKFRNMRRGIRSDSTGMTADSSTAHSPISCRFDSVCFINERFGWVAGGYDVPFVNRSRAVMMRTSDGGVSWEPVENLVVPRISQIHFSSPVMGWAVGEAGNLFNSGVFQTTSGGASWSSQTSEKQNSIRCAAAVQNGLVTVDEFGKPGVYVGDRHEASILPRDVASVNKLVMTDDQVGFAAGDDGTLLQTSNGGKSWSRIESVDSQPAIKQIDLTFLSHTDGKVWFGGSPGTHIFQLDVKTGKVSNFRTPTNLPINDIQFVDEQLGWAVGAMGSIYATRDGGQNWVLQRGDHSRVAMLCVAEDIRSLPLEVFAAYAGEEDRICSLMLLSGNRAQLRIATQAAERLGCVISTSASNTITNADLEMDAKEESELLRQVVLNIRAQRPNVVLGQPNRRKRTSKTDAIDLLQRAIRLAADSLAFPEQINELGLKPWQVNRFVALDPTGDVSVDADRLLPRSGSLIEDQIGTSRALLYQSLISNTDNRYRVYHFTGSNRLKAGNLLSGIAGAGEVPTRKTESKRGNLTIIQQASAKQREFERFVKFDANTPGDFLVWRQQVESFALPMDPGLAGTWLMQLTERYLEEGKTELAAASANMLITRWPDHAFAPAALTWLVHYYSSTELGEIELKKKISSGASGGTMGDFAHADHQPVKRETIQHNGVSHIIWTPVEQQQKKESKVQQVGYNEDISSLRKTFFENRLRSASHFLSKLGQRDPELMASSQYRFLAAQISRRINGDKDAEGRFKSLVQRREFSGAAISEGAQRELGLQGMSSIPKNRIANIYCTRIHEKPLLDGVLKESFWHEAAQAGKAIQAKVNHAADSQSVDVGVFAFDDEYLYGAFQCQKMSGEYYQSRKQARPRDADLSHRDRIEITLDLDRDYRSANRFVVDHRGWVNESCSGCIGWNPDWYVGQSEDGESWTVEFAIPIEALTSQGISEEDVWAIQLSRRAYDDRDLWGTARSDATSQDSESALLTGLKSTPSGYELMQFEASSQPSQSD